MFFFRFQVLRKCVMCKLSALMYHQKGKKCLHGSSKETSRLRNFKKQISVENNACDIIWFIFPLVQTLIFCNNNY